MRIMFRYVAVILASGAMGGAVFSREAPAPAPAVSLRFEAAPLVDCYFMLRTYGKDYERSGTDPKMSVTSEADIYRRAVGTLTDPVGWRWFEDQVVAGPDPNAIRAATRNLPPVVDERRTGTGINMLVDGLESAYPKFLAAWWPERQKSLNRVLVPARKLYLQAESRIADTWMKKSVFSAVDAPINVLLTVRAGGVGSWGKAGGAYYTIVGVQGLSAPIMIETGIHEATHILEALQPFDSRNVWKRLRQGLASEQAEHVDTFLHGLVAYNAGSLVKRFVDQTHRPAGILAPSHREEYAPYVSTYDVVWNAYLDGKLDADGVVAKLIEEFKAVRKFEEAKKKRS